jgi:hypothetical protein
MASIPIQSGRLLQSERTLSSELLFEVSLRHGQVRHAVKTGLACVLATTIAYYFHIRSEQLSPLFAFLLFSMGMPSPRMNWLLTQLAVIASALGTAIILVLFNDSWFLYLALTFLWIVGCLSFSGWLPVPATMAGMITAISLFTFLEGDVGGTLHFLVDYNVNFLIGGLSVVVVHTFVWPLNTPKVFVSRLAQVYTELEQHCREGSRCLRSGETPPPQAALEDWAPFRPLRQLVAPELFRRRATTNPFAGLIIACRSMNVRLWFFNRALRKISPTALPLATREQLADQLDGCAVQLKTLVTGAIERRQVGAVDPNLLRDLASAQSTSSHSDPLVEHGIPASILHFLARDVQSATALHNTLFTHFGHGFGGELVNLWPGANRAALFDTNSVKAGVKLVLILALLMLEEGWLGLPGSTQVAFFATFFASTANLGRQSKTDIVDVAGLLSGFCYGLLAAFITSRLPHFSLLLALVFLGQFLADYAYQRLPKYSVAGLQAGLAIPFTFLATIGPEWGSFTMVRTRLAGLLLAGFTAVVVHALVWPVLPMRQLRSSIADALRGAADTIGKLFAGPRTAWSGPPPNLRDTIVRARDLLDDARYLPGPEHADLTYGGALASLQVIDASLEYIQMLLCLDEENPNRQRFFAELADFADEAQRNLSAVAEQFHDPPRRSDPVVWESQAVARWEKIAPNLDFSAGTDPRRLVVIASCLDQIAAATTHISTVIGEINARDGGR